MSTRWSNEQPSRVHHAARRRGGRVAARGAGAATSRARSGASTMRTKSLTPEQMEARVARFNTLQTYQRQNFETHNIPPGAVEKVAARRVYPVMAPADYQGRSAGAPVKGPRGFSSASPSANQATGRACTAISIR